MFIGNHDQFDVDIGVDTILDQDAQQEMRELAWNLRGYTKRQKMALRKVQAGVAYLDGGFGAGNWEIPIQEALRTGDLNIRYRDVCMIGHLFGDYNDRLAEGDFTHMQAQNMGFQSSRRVSYELLAWAWKTEMRSMGW